ncbi:hypothetical protein O6H91_09G012000 [Diphasiastrum complanatum]|uniref:Uncharacterized protein n=1 Tax=Diphasiastrum complanatum TaxID=34168 RepID=A0ACC2CLE1_DIPCM|nr:hypothetical protein O6H91_09G012000 [Diphasiastrum complanatum]
MRGEMCAVRVHIHKIARKTNGKPSRKLKRFCMRNLNPKLTIDQAPSNAVAMLVWADFPTSLCVKHYGDNKTILTWNIFSVDLAATAFEIASIYVVNQEWFACTSLPKHLPIVDSFAAVSRFSLHRCLNILCEEGYVRHNPR